MQLCDISSNKPQTVNVKVYREFSQTSHLIHQDAKLGWILVHKNLISQAQLNAALDTQSVCHRHIGELLMEQQLISEQELQQALKEQHWRRNGYWVI